MNRTIGRVMTGGVSIGAALLVSPAMALAATPEGTTGGSGIVPGPDPVSTLVEIVMKVAAIAIALAILVALGYGVAHIGGRAATAASEGHPERHGSRVGRTAIVLVAAVAAVIGVLAGREIAQARSAGGFGFIGAAVISLFVIAVVIGLLIVGLVATKFRHGHVSSAIASLLAAAALLTVGTIGGGAAASAFGGLYHEPVTLEARGETRIAMRTTGGTFVAKDGGLASCHSTPDGRGVGGLTALDLGELGPGTLRAGLDFWGPRPDQAGGSFFIDGADIPDGASQPTWTATVVIVQTAADGASGKLTFEGRADAVDFKDPGGSVGAPAASGWPAQIAGTITWTCGSW
jgi:hypothetical protein